MLKLKRYSFSGIGRFVEKQTIDLESRSHLIQIDGENINTGGSSGAGKSTTVEALAYLFGISEIPSTQLQSRITKSPIWVQGEFEGDITITRSKKDGLTIKTPEGTVSGNSKLAEERLDQIIGVSRNLLKTMCYKRQKQGGFFLNLTPKESHKFLIECLDLGEFQSKIFKLEDNLKNKYKPDKIRLEASIDAITEGVKQLNSLLEQKAMPIKPELGSIKDKELHIDLLKQELDTGKHFYEAALKDLGPKPLLLVTHKFEKEDELQRVLNEISELKEIMKNNELAKTIAVDQASTAVRKIKDRIKEIDGYKEDMVRVDKTIHKLLDDAQHIESGDCPTCLRVWNSIRNKEKLIQINDEVKLYKETLNTYKEEVLKYPHYKVLEEKAEQILKEKKQWEPNVLEEKDMLELQEKYRILQNEKDNTGSVERQEFLELCNKWRESFDHIDNNHENTKLKLKDKIAKLEYEIDKIKLQAESYREALKTFETDINNIKEKRDGSYLELTRNKKELEEIKNNILLSEESIRLIKNFTLQKFQDTLDYIGGRATEIINNIPNMANAVIYFENAKETKSGKIKNEVSAVINLEGDSGIPIKTLSGGERTSADFAIDLAIGEMIENMTQKGVNFLIIDEGFDGLDSISKIQCIEMLKTLNTDKKILMVDHSSEVKEMVCDIIKVIRTNEESVVQ